MKGLVDPMNQPHALYGIWNVSEDDWEKDEAGYMFYETESDANGEIIRYDSDDELRVIKLTPESITT